MVREIMRDTAFLAQKAENAVPEDKHIAEDLLDTLKFHKDGCVGMAANMIGENKRIIAVDDGGKYIVMYNPEIIKKADVFETVEGCLSLTGTRKTKRYKTVKIKYLNEDFQQRIKNFTGFTAQIIQHEIDHLNGIII